jgi:cytochrome P450
MDVLQDLYGTGRETSATTLQWAMSELMRHPKVMHKAQAEVRNTLQGKPNVTLDDVPGLKYIRLVIKETMRLHPPTPLLIPRKAMKPCKILGYDIPKGTTVLVNAWAVGRDPRHWEDPNEFKPERLEPCIIDFNDEAVFEHIPSTSLLTLAHDSMEIVLATLLYHFDWELPGGVEVDMTEEMMGLTLRQKKDLYLHAVVRVHQI